MRFGLPTLLLAAMFATRVADADVRTRIPVIPRPLSLRDFEGMQPSPEIASALGHTDLFIQQTPSDGQPASQPRKSGTATPSPRRMSSSSVITPPQNRFMLT